MTHSVCICSAHQNFVLLVDAMDWDLTYKDLMKFNYCQWDTTDRAILTTFTATYEEYKKTLIDVIDDLTRHSDIAKLKITSSWYKTKSKVPTGVRNTANYTPWLYTIYCQMVALNSDDNNHYTSFLYQVQTMLLYYLKANHPYIIKNRFTSRKTFYFSKWTPY